MRTSLIMMAIAVTGCGGSAQFKYELIGRGDLRVVPSAVAGDPGAAPAATVEVAAGEQVSVSWELTQPFAEEIGFRIACGDAESSGQLGESIERYGERRVAQLRSERDEKRAAEAKAASEQAERDAAAAEEARKRPRGGGGNGRVVVRTPVGQAGVDISIVGQVIGPRGPTPEQIAAAQRQAAYDAALDAGVLPPGDVGGGKLTGAETLAITAGGACAMVVLTDTPGITGTFTVERIRDLHAEAAVVRAARADVAIQVRADVMSGLVIQGADPTLQPRRRAEAQLAIEVEHARVEAVATAQRQLEGQRRQSALDCRQRITWALIAGGADPDFQARQASEAEQARAVAASLGAEADRAQAARIQLQFDAALDVRVRVMSGLVAQGALRRPERPVDVLEEPGGMPIEGMVWVPGAWSWSGGAWAWSAGGWVDARGGFIAAGVAGGSPTASTTAGTTTTSTTSAVGDVLGAAATVLGGIGGTVTVTVTPAPPRKPKPARPSKRPPTVLDHREPK